MRRKSSGIVAILAFAVLSTACSQQADIGITTKVKSLLESDRAISTSAQIQVTTEKKVVTLAGPVESPAVKAHAVTLAKGVEGVKKVVDNLTVAPPSAAAAQPSAPEAASGTTTAPTDTAITQAVKEKLLLQPETASGTISVDTHDGVVTLTGTVKSPQEKEQVIQTARNTQGVQRVEDKLSVSSS